MTEEIIALLDNPDFRLWVLFPDAASNEYWDKMAINYPEKEHSIQKARLIFAKLSESFEVDFPGSETIDKMLIKILESR